MRPRSTTAIVEPLEGRQLFSAGPHMGTMDVTTATRPAAVVATPRSNAVGTPASIQAAAGLAFVGTVGTLRGARGVAPDFRNLRATIDWGDGTTPTDATFARAKGAVQIGGTHTYAQAGQYAVTVTVAEGKLLPHGQPPASFPTRLAAIASTATVGTANVATGVTINETAGKSFTATLGSFPLTRNDLSLQPSISWGDGSSSSGTLTQGQGSTELVRGTHTYAHPGTYAIHVTVGGGLKGNGNAPVPLIFLIVANFDSTAVVAP